MMMGISHYNCYKSLNDAVNGFLEKNKKMRTFCITGCLGFIGSHFTRRVLKKGWKVYGIDAETYAAKLEYLEEFKEYPNFSYECVDISNLIEIPRCEYIINFAAESHVDNSIESSEHFLSSNIGGIANILNLLINKDSTLLHISTDEVYGDLLEGAHREIDVLKPSNPYSSTKAAADMLICGWGRTHNIKYKIVRPTNNYGPGQNPEKLIPASIKALSLGRKIKLHNNGTPIRNWLHVEDTVDAILHVIKKGELNNIYNIAGGFEQTNRDTVATLLEKFFGREVNLKDYVDFSYSRPGQDLRYAVDDTKIQVLGWSPKKIFNEEIGEIVKSDSLYYTV